MTNPTEPQDANTKNITGESPSTSRPPNFDTRFAALMDGFGQACEREGVKIAVAIAVHPDEKSPLIFSKGHEFDVAEILAIVNRHMTEDLLRRLSGKIQRPPE